MIPEVLVDQNAKYTRPIAPIDDKEIRHYVIVKICISVHLQIYYKYSRENK